MISPRTARISRVFVIIAALVGSLLLAPISVAAHPSNTAGWSLTLKLANGPSLTYRASAAPIFTGILTAPSGASVDNMALAIDVAGMTTLNPNALQQTSSTTYSYTASTDWSQLSAGTLTATAYYSTNATSSPLTFTVKKDTTSLECQIASVAGHVTAPNTALTVTVVPQATYAGIGPGDGTYTIDFLDAHGVTVSTFPNLSMDSQSHLSGVTAPAQYGVYKMTCAYSGTQDLAPAQGNTQTFIVSQEQALSGAQLYTNPTTMQNNQKWQAYVVLNGQTGGPTPTGSIGIDIPGCKTYTIPVGSNGETLAQLSPITGCPPYAGIYVSYSGDPYYKDNVFTFPLTNPAIPASVLGSASGSASGSTPTSTGQGQTSQGQITPTSGSQDSSTATATATSASLGSSGSVDAFTTTQSSGGNSMLWLLIVVLVIVLLGGGVGAFFLVSRRAKITAHGTNPTSDPASIQPRWPQHRNDRNLADGDLPHSNGWPPYNQ